MYPVQYIEASVVNPSSNSGQQQNSDTNYSSTNNVTGGSNVNNTNPKVVWASASSNSVSGGQDKSDNPSSQASSAAATAAAIYTSLSGGQTATIIPASALQQAARDHATVHLQPHAQIVHHGGNAYLVQSTGRLEDDSPNLSHTTKASPVTVQWLCENYETADGVSLPRSTLYNHYLQHCQQEKLEPMNQASFGKLIRSVFYGLRTRRLGTRGNSKYHYYGIRIKPNSPLNHYVEDQTFAMRQYPSFHRQSEYHWRNKYSSNGLSYNTNNNSGTNAVGLGNNLGSGNVNSSSQSGTSAVSYINSTSLLTGNGANSGFGSGGITNPNVLGADLSTAAGGQNGMGGGSTTNGNTNQHSNYLGESTSALPNLGDIVARAELDSLTDEECQHHNVTMDDINVFCQLYLDHSDTVLGSVVYLNFKFIENHWQDFWRTSSKPQNCQWEDKLPKSQLFRLLKIPQIHKFLQLFDNVFYQSLVEVLIPNVLRPIPSALTQSIRHFAKSLEGWMATATAGLPASVISVKMSCVCALAQTLRRHTSLNHLAQAARAVLKNASQIGQMLTDLNRVDFANVQEQASWVCSGCDSSRVDSLQHDFKRILQQQASLEEWAVWLDRVVTDYLEPHRNSSRYPAAAHNFILRWSFYSSMVIRDLTLRSAASFGSFHLIRLLYDEYIYYLVEQKVADHLDLTPVAVTGDVGRQLMASEYNTGDNINLQVDMINDMEDSKSRIRDDEENDNKPSLCLTRECIDDSLDNVLMNSTTDSQNPNVVNGTATTVSTENDGDDISDDGSMTNAVVSTVQSLTSNSSSNNNSSSGPAGSLRSTITTATPNALNTTNVTSTIMTTPKVEPQRPPTILGSSGVRKTVNVTTFGDPLPTTNVTNTNLIPNDSSATSSSSSLLTRPSISTPTTTLKVSPSSLSSTQQVQQQQQQQQTQSYQKPTDSTPTLVVSSISTLPPSSKRIKLVNNFTT